MVLDAIVGGKTLESHFGHVPVTYMRTRLEYVVTGATLQKRPFLQPDYTPSPPVKKTILVSFLFNVFLN